MRAVVCFAVFFGVAVSACGAVLDIPSSVSQAVLTDGGAADAAADADPSADVAGQCGASTDTDECYKCTDESCCNEYTACKADPRCGDYYKSCIPDCKKTGKSYDQCVVQCDGTNGAGHSTYLPYLACSELHCLAQCSNNAPDPCSQCLYASCRDQNDACLRDRQCDTLRACVGVCNAGPSVDRQSCVDACSQNAGATAQDKFNGLTTCSLQFCTTICSN